MANIDKISVKNTVYNIVSPAVVSDYIEVIGGACTKPDGYEEDEVILAKQNDVQLLFKATQDIAFGANIVENTNCVRTTLEEVLKNAGGGGGASSADQVSYDNSDSGLEAENVQEAIDEVQGNVVSVNSALTNKAYLTDDTAITEVASDDLLPIYDTSATAKKKIAVSDFVGGLVSNPNLFDNPWFTVNQRGFSNAPISGHLLDRWEARSTTGASLSNGIMTFTNNRSDGNTWFGQNIELDYARQLVGKTVTASILTVNNTLASWTFAINDDSTKITCPVKTVDGTRINFQLEWITGKAAFYFWLNTYQQSISLKAIKLELGSVSTLAMDTAPNYATELLKCQRYFNRFWYSEIGWAHCIATNTWSCIAHLPCVMRAAPTISLSTNGQIGIHVATGDDRAGTPTINNYNEGGEPINIGFDLVGITGTAGEVGRVYIGNYYLMFSADL